MSTATRGRAAEHELIHQLEQLDAWPIIRSAGSKGVLDVVAFLNGRWIGCQVKVNGWPGPAERRAMAEVSARTGMPVYAVRRDVGKPVLRWAIVNNVNASLLEGGTL